MISLLRTSAPALHNPHRPGRTHLCSPTQPALGHLLSHRVTTMPWFSLQSTRGRPTQVHLVTIAFMTLEMQPGLPPPPSINCIVNSLALETHSRMSFSLCSLALSTPRTLGAGPCTVAAPALGLVSETQPACQAHTLARLQPRSSVNSMNHTC